MFLFTGNSLEYASVGFVVDYQNIHLTAHYLFTPNQTKQESLLHPLRLAESVLNRREHFFKNQVTQYEITQVRVFRGLPSNKQEPQRYAQNLSQKSEWSKDKRVIVEYLGLNKLRLAEQQLFHTFLTREDFENSIDQKDYSKRGC